MGRNPTLTWPEHLQKLSCKLQKKLGIISKSRIEDRVPYYKQIYDNGHGIEEI